MGRKRVAPAPSRGLNPWQVTRLFAALALALAIGVGIGMDIAATETGAERKAEVEQVISLTALARGTHQSLVPIVEAIAAGLPAADDWARRLAVETERWSETVSGTTEVNVARAGFRAAVGLLAAAVDNYVAGQREIAARERGLAVAVWSVAATQLDQLNVDAGNGHQHVYLSDRAEPGAIPPDQFSR